MKIGLLVCASVPDNLIHLSGSIPDMYQNLFKKNGLDFDLKIFDVVKGELPDMDDPLSGFICTGSPCSVYDDLEWIKKLKQFVQDVYRKRKKIVGICFGHQIIAEALGGKVACSSRGWGIGIQEARIEQTRKWMIPGLDVLNILVSYRDQVITLPADSILLAGNSHCRNFMFEVQNIALGIQGHPEFDKNYAKALFLSRRESIGHERVEKAMSSLNNCLHPGIFTKWIYHFFLSS